MTGLAGGRAGQRVVHRDSSVKTGLRLVTRVAFGSASGHWDVYCRLGHCRAGAVVASVAGAGPHRVGRSVGVLSLGPTGGRLMTGFTQGYPRMRCGVGFGCQTQCSRGMATGATGHNRDIGVKFGR